MVLAEFKSKAQEKREEKEIYKIWADTIKDRDGRTCLICGSTHDLASHHLCPREHKLWLLELDNGITLCCKHHKFCRNISAHNNPFAFFLWLERYRPQLYAILRARQRMILEKQEGIIIP